MTRSTNRGGASSDDRFEGRRAIDERFHRAAGVLVARRQQAERLAAAPRGLYGRDAVNASSYAAAVVKGLVFAIGSSARRRGRADRRSERAPQRRKRPVGALIPHRYLMSMEMRLASFIGPPMSHLAKLWVTEHDLVRADASAAVCQWRFADPGAIDEDFGPGQGIDVHGRREGLKRSGARRPA